MAKFRSAHCMLLVHKTIFLIKVVLVHLAGQVQLKTRCQSALEFQVNRTVQKDSIVQCVH